MKVTRGARLAEHNVRVGRKTHAGGALRPEKKDTAGSVGPSTETKTMKIKNSLKALMGRHRDNRMVRRKGRIYIINKKAPRFKARQC